MLAILFSNIISVFETGLKVIIFNQWISELFGMDSLEKYLDVYSWKVKKVPWQEINKGETNFFLKKETLYFR